MENIHRNEKIDILRGIAIILVMAGHGIGLLIQVSIIPSNIEGGVFMILSILFICPYFF